jgi:predicted nucleic acid-binding protein
MKTSFRIVPDTNVVIASQKSRSESSPNKELFVRWQNEEFELLHSDDTLLEYIEKLRDFSIPEEVIKKLIRALLALGQHVNIEFFHLPVYPSDPDDIAFLLCAMNGQASHIITYDPHFQEIERFYAFRVCGTLAFLFELREGLAGKE